VINSHTNILLMLMMQIIPVIDLLNGVVVHAKRGKRQDYQPIQSRLTASNHPLDITAALFELYPFQTLYIADLAAICGAGNHNPDIEAISLAYPNVTIWLDCGIGQMNARALYLGGNIRPVVGSENIQSLQDYRAISYACNSKHALSLDYSATCAMGIRELHNSARFWPDDTICMTLSAVGSGQGVDIDRLNEIIRMNNSRKTPSNIYAAGGIRHANDLITLKKMGVHGALIASALHNQQLSYQDLVDLQA
jgi:phosphoribosylformimino-5-aminoimidazole carboxamide ribotide isomerase